MEEKPVYIETDKMRHAHNKPSMLRHVICVCILLVAQQSVQMVNGHAKMSGDSVPEKHMHGQRFAMEPQDQTAIVGSRVTLPCRVINKQGTLQWTKDDFGLGWHRNLSGFERYTMIGSDEEGDFSLGKLIELANIFSFSIAGGALLFGCSHSQTRKHFL